MKLIDLLVQELPKRGGWPEGVVKIHQDYDGETWAWLNHDSAERLFTLDQVATNARKFCKNEKCENMVTRDQYETTLAASQKVEWDGAGTPPAGCDCEAKQFAQINWNKFKVVAVNSGAVFGFFDNGVASALDGDKWEFRPIHSEEDKNRDVAVAAMLSVFGSNAATGTTAALKAIYDAIAAGKIPGVRIK